MPVALHPFHPCAIIRPPALPRWVMNRLDDMTPAVGKLARSIIETAWSDPGLVLTASPSALQTITGKGEAFVRRGLRELAELFGLKDGWFTFPFWDETRKRKALSRERSRLGGLTTSLRRQTRNADRNERELDAAALLDSRRRIAWTAERYERARGLCEVLDCEVNGRELKVYEPGTPETEPGMLSGRLEATCAMMKLEGAQARLRTSSLQKLGEMHRRKILTISDQIVAIFCGGEFFVSEWLPRVRDG